jgi:predicted secreted protein
MLRVVGLALMLSLGVAPPAWADAAPEPPQGPVTIVPGASEMAGEASVGVGGHVVVKLTVSGGTGYSWKLSSEAGPELSLAGQRTERTAARMGAPQAAVFDFEAQAAGQKELTFELMPPGAGGDAARTYSLSVTVSE